MKRLSWLLLIPLLAAAGPLKRNAPPLPVPPIPPAHPPTAQSAPIPDPDVVAPLAGSLMPDVKFRDFRASQYATSPGYAPGSQFQTTEDKRPIQTPGVTWKVPLQ
ncbi:MAG TPA: hypothetical protein VKT26_00195 [Acetobacteraceae bacterium]|nr:hypothetical protein [Acetobacteraceae bacterium]